MQNETLNLTSAQAVPLGIYSCLMVILSVLGNTIVIYGSARHDAIKLDKVSVIFIQNLAVADILYTLITVFPSSVTYFAGKWVLGRGWCFVQAQCRFVPGMVNCVLVLSITLHRLVLFTFPRRTIVPRTALLCSVVYWVAALVITSSILGRHNAKERFDREIGACVSTLFENGGRGARAVLISTALMIFLPLILICITNILICYIAVKHSRGRRDWKERSRKGILLTCLLSGLFIVSWSPYIARNINSQVSPPVTQEMELLAYNCLAINSFANPILYSLTNEAFRKYVLGLPRRLGQLIYFEC